MNNKDLTQNNDRTEKIEIFSTEDEKIKSFGELLTNDSSRNILQILMKEEMTALDLSKKTNLSLPLVIYHLNKMKDLNVIQISKVKTNVKGQDMKFYKATKFAIVILPSTVSEKAKESKSLLRSFNSLYRFAGIAIAGIAAWFSSTTLQEPRTVTQPTLEDEITMNDESVEETSEFSGDGQEIEQIQSSSKPEPEPVPESTRMEQDTFTSGEEAQTVEESLELAKRTIDTSDVDASEFAGALPEDFVIPVIITVAVIGTGLFLEMLYRHRISKIKK